MVRVEKGLADLWDADYNANTDSVPYILDQFAYYFEGPFDTTDPDFAQCAIDRPGKDTSPDGRMYLVNHYLDIELPFDIFIPDQINAPMTNSLDSILQQAELCDDTYSRMPNVILVSQYTLPSSGNSRLGLTHAAA